MRERVAAQGWTVCARAHGQLRGGRVVNPAAERIDPRQHDIASFRSLPLSCSPRPVPSCTGVMFSSSKNSSKAAVLSSAKGGGGSLHRSPGLGEVPVSVFCKARISHWPHCFTMTIGMMPGESRAVSPDGRMKGGHPHLAYPIAMSGFRSVILPIAGTPCLSVIERHGERCRGRKCRGRPHVVPGCPAGDVAGP